MITELLKRKSLTAERIFQSVLPNVTWSSLFMASYGAGVMAVLCFLRQQFGIPFSPLSALLAGFLAPLIALLCERESRRRELSIYLFSQGLEVCWRLLSSRGFLPSFQKTVGDVIVFSSGLWLWLRVMRLSEKARKGGIGFLLSEFLDYPPTSRSSRRITGELAHLHAHLFVQNDSKPTLLAQVMAQVVKSITLGCFIKFVFNVAGMLTRKRSFGSLFLTLFDSDSIRLSTFLTCTAVTFTVLHRAVRQDPSVAGAIAGLSFGFYPSTELAMYLLTKAMAAQWDLWSDEKLVPHIPYGSALLGAFSSAPTIYASFFEPHNLRPSFMRWILKYSPGPYPCVPRQFRPTVPPPGSL